MRKYLVSAAVVAAALAATPSAAQYQDYGRYNPYGYGYNQQGRDVLQQLRQIEQRIDRAADRGAISRNEARRLFRHADQIERLYDRYRRNGLSRGEVQDLRNRIQWLRQQIRWERRDERRDDRRWDDRRDRWDD